MLITDLDLLRIAPAVFIDAAAHASSLISATDGDIAGTTLTSASSDFEAAGIDAGHVVVAGTQVLEVTARLAPTQLAISSPRSAEMTEPIDPSPGSTLALAVRTFERLALEEESWVLGALGIDAAHATRPLDSSVIVNLDRVKRFIAARTIARACALASAATPADEALAAKLVEYRRIASALRRQTIAVLDLDGDGVADATRRIDAVTLTRL